MQMTQCVDPLRLTSRILCLQFGPIRPTLARMRRTFLIAVHSLEVQLRMVHLLPHSPRQVLIRWNR